MSMCEWHSLLQGHSKAGDPKSHKHFVFGAPRTQEIVMAVYLHTVINHNGKGAHEYIALLAGAPRKIISLMDLLWSYICYLFA